MYQKYIAITAIVVLCALWIYPSCGETLKPPIPVQDIQGHKNHVVYLNDLIHAALFNNKDLSARHHEIQSVKHEGMSAGVLEDPMLSLGLTNFPLIDMSFRSEPMTMKVLTLEQKLPFLGKRDLIKKLSQQMVSILQQEGREKELEIIQEVKDTYYEFVYACQAVDITEKNIQLLQHLIKVAQIQYEIGNVSIVDTLKSQVELSKLHTELLTLLKKKETISTKLKKLTYMDQNVDLGSPDLLHPIDIPLDFTDLVSTAYQSRSLLMKLDQEIENVQTRIQLVEKEKKPDLTVGVMYGQRDNMSDLFGVELGVNLPVYNKLKRHPLVQSLQERIEVIVDKIEDEKNTLRYEIKNTLIDIEKEREVMDMIETTILPQVHNILNVSLSNYEVGKTSFMALIDAQLMAYQYELEYQRALTNLYMNVGKLERIVGIRLI